MANVACNTKLDKTFLLTSILAQVLYASELAKPVTFSKYFSTTRWLLGKPFAKAVVSVNAQIEDVQSYANLLNY